MVENYMCKNCDHVMVCKKSNVIDKFDTDSKKYIDIDIQMLSCKDFSPVSDAE